ncbi:MAG: hypothetical protein U0169_08515 [Polyangiaceae bacterium]
MSWFFAQSISTTFCAIWRRKRRSSGRAPNAKAVSEFGVAPSSV